MNLISNDYPTCVIDYFDFCSAPFPDFHCFAEMMNNDKLALPFVVEFVTWEHRQWKRTRIKFGSSLHKSYQIREKIQSLMNDDGGRRCDHQHKWKSERGQTVERFDRCSFFHLLKRHSRQKSLFRLIESRHYSHWKRNQTRKYEFEHHPHQCKKKCEKRVKLSQELRNRLKVIQLNHDQPLPIHASARARYVKSGCTPVAKQRRITRYEEYRCWRQDELIIDPLFAWKQHQLSLNKVIHDFWETLSKTLSEMEMVVIIIYIIIIIFIIFVMINAGHFCRMHCIFQPRKQNH